MTLLIASLITLSPVFHTSGQDTADTLLARYVDTLEVESPSLETAIILLNRLRLLPGMYLIRLTTKKGTVILRYIKVPER